ncbi:MAG: adenosylcobinamide-phosphate synthase CbiB, partial [Alphaproteobacteria bacterium]
MLVPWLPEAAFAVHPSGVLLAALLIDAAFGDPASLYRIIPHPVAGLGNLIAAMERKSNRDDAPPSARLWAGAALVGAVVAGAALAGWGAAFLFNLYPGGWLLEALLASTLIACRGLYDHVRRVAEALERDSELARDAVRHIVGRDPDNLDDAAIARAAIESAAENFSDGVVAPMFWFALFGLPGIAAYKAVNTLDSMIGHRTPRFDAFGRVAARLDDAANWIPARIAGALIACAALTNMVPAWRIMLRYAARHRSPNAGWPEAAMAGALGLALAGPRRYGGEVVDDAWMGEGRQHAKADDISAALRIY